MKGDNIIDNKLETISNLFEDKEIRSIWDSEKETKKSAISKSNSLNYKYIDELKQIENKEGEIYE